MALGVLKIPSVVLLVAALAVGVACADEAAAPAHDATSPSATATVLASPLITIDEPPGGARVSVPFEISGTANVFEGALQVEVVADTQSGHVYCTHHVQATSGTGTPGTWRTEMAFAFPQYAEADAPVVIRAFNLSARDGSVENVVERRVLVTSEKPRIIVTSPGCSEDVSMSSLLTVTGLALVFEAQLQVDVRDAGGAQLITTGALASSGTELSPWSTTLDLSGLPGAGIYQLVAYNHSAEDGSIENEFAVPIVVGP
ncbi:MAG: Gmad2 immunoglobulin-like domain-containing protein [Dehalococcoidia bacterium]